MTKLLIAEDDPEIAMLERDYLEMEGFQTEVVDNGQQAVTQALRGEYDLILLDLMLPGLSREEVLSRISGVPVMVVSAKAGVDDKVNLLLGGAADYITKPFDSRELLARIAVRLRDSAGSDLSRPLEAGDLRLDSASHAVTVRGVPVRLTKTEYAILKLFLQNPGQAIAKSVILDRISADTPDCTENSLKIHVSNLRKKLRDVTGIDYIESVWGIGFKLNP